MALTKRRALEICCDLWAWLAKNPNEEKENWPEWEFNEGSVPEMVNYCPCCEYVCQFFKITEQELSGAHCPKCPLAGKWHAPEMDNKLARTNEKYNQKRTPTEIMCDDETGLFSLWVVPRDEARAYYAKAIRDIAIEALKELGASEG
jgi:hypothetical protein